MSSDLVTVGADELALGHLSLHSLDAACTYNTSDSHITLLSAPVNVIELHDVPREHLRAVGTRVRLLVFTNEAFAGPHEAVLMVADPLAILPSPCARHFLAALRANTLGDQGATVTTRSRRKLPSFTSLNSDGQAG